MQPWRSPFPIRNPSVVPCPVLTAASWPAHRFLSRQVRWSVTPISLRIFHSWLWSTVKDFSVVHEAEVDAFLEFSCFFLIQQVLAGSFVFAQSSLNIWTLSVHVLLKPSSENLEHYFAGVWNECNCAVVWAFFGIAFLWDWNENWPLPVLWQLLSFPNLLAYWVQHFHSIIFQDLK